MSGYDPQRRRRLTTRANTTAVEALLDGEAARPRRRDGARHASAAPEPGAGRSEERSAPEVVIDEPTPAALEARSGCLSALLTLGRR